MRNDPLSERYRVRGRGTTGNPAVRFETTHREAWHDGWDLDEDLPVLRTQLREETAKSIIATNSSPDLSFDRSINPYRGCEHGCIYCYARPSHAYLGLSPGLDFETQLTVKPNAAALLEKALRHPRYQPKTIAIGTNTDAYQPIEKDRRIMRDVLQVLADFNHPTAIVTKGTLIARDIDVLAPMAARGILRVGISITTLDAGLSRKLEPRVPSPAARLRVIRALADAGVPVRVMISPVIPALTDHEVEAILAAAKDAGAIAASSIMLRLPREVAPMFKDWLEMHVPDRAARVMNRVRDLHGGKDYDAAFGKRMAGQGVWADLHRQRFRQAVARLGLDRALAPLRTDLFAVPPSIGDQLALF